MAKVQFEKCYDDCVAPLAEPCPPQEATHRAVRQGGRIRFLLPADSAARRAAIRFFAPGVRGGLSVRARSLATTLSGGESHRASELTQQILASLGGTGASFAIAHGTPGPWTKSALLLLDQQNHPLALVKVGITEDAAGLIRNESEWLTRLAASPKLAPRVPRNLGFSSSGTVTWLAQEPLAGGACLHALGQQQLDFLNILHSELPVSRGFIGSIMQQEMRLRLEAMKDAMSEAWRARSFAALAAIERELEDTQPMVAAHRDFIPANIKQQSDGIGVYDWEYARLGYLPTYDALHYQLAVAVLRQTLNAGCIDKALVAAGAGTGRTSLAHAVAYMLDLSLFYMSSVDGVFSSHPLLDGYALAIDDCLRRGVS